MEGRIFLVLNIEYQDFHCHGLVKKCPWAYGKKSCRLFGKLVLSNGKLRRSDKCIDHTLLTEENPNGKEKEVPEENHNPDTW